MVQENTPIPQEVAPVTNNLGTALGVVAVEARKDLVMGEAVLLLGLSLGPCALNLVVVFGVAAGDGVVDVVADGLDLCLEGGVLLGGGLEEDPLLLLELDLFLEFLGGIFLGLGP